MKRVEISTNFGRFAYTASADFAEISEPVSKTLQKVLEDGLASICFRAGGSEAEKALVKGKHMVKDQKRSEVAYSLEAQNVLEQSFNSKLKELELDVEVAFIGEHEFGQTEVSMKMAEELFRRILAMPVEAQAGAALVYGYDENDSKDVILQKLHKFLGGLKAPRKTKS